MRGCEYEMVHATVLSASARTSTCGHTCANQFMHTFFLLHVQANHFESLLLTSSFHVIILKGHELYPSP